MFSIIVSDRENDIYYTGLCGQHIYVNVILLYNLYVEIAICQYDKIDGQLNSICISNDNL